VQALLQQLSHLYSQEPLLHQRRRFRRPKQKLAMNVLALDSLQKVVAQKDLIFAAWR
jgi:hypothetical protein